VCSILSNRDAELIFVLLAAFSDSGWLPGGHAVRMAIDMGINRSFIQLLRSGMGKGKSKAELEEERQLVVHSRVWFCVSSNNVSALTPAVSRRASVRTVSRPQSNHRMAYGMGRPAILREDESIHNCRRLLEHPLSITSDVRLVSTVELTALRGMRTNARDSCSSSSTHRAYRVARFATGR
jgi:hypothetical protein